MVLGHRADEVETLLGTRYAESVLRIVRNSDYATTDMLASVKVGVAALENCDAFYLLPGDMPAISRETFVIVKKAMEERKTLLSFPLFEGRKKHPPLIARSCIPRIMSFAGDGGLRALWGQLEKETVFTEVVDRGCSLDADTKEDYERLTEYMKVKLSGG